MDLDVDGTTILYGTSTLFGALAVLYFGRTFLFGLSGATKSILLFLGFVAFILAARSIDDSRLTTMLYVLGTASYLSFFVYTVAIFDLSTDHVFLFLAASSILFAGLAYLIRDDRFGPETIDLRRAGIVMAVLAVSVIGIDVAGPQVSYDVTFTDQLNTTTGSADIGSVSASNPHVLPREVDMPPYQACIDINGTREIARVTADGLPSMLMGGQQAAGDLEVRARLRAGPGTEAGTIPVIEDRNCPQDTATDRVTIVTGDDRLEAPAFD